MYRFSVATNKINAAQTPTETTISSVLEGTMRINPLFLIKDEKLDTQNGMRKRRNVCHLSNGLWPVPTLRTSAVPMTALMPAELSQIMGEGSK